MSNAIELRTYVNTGGFTPSAAGTFASLVSNEELSPEYIIPSPFDERVADAVANAVIKANN